MTGDRVALVCGGTSGIGLAAAAALRRDGFTVVVGGRDASRRADAVDALRESAAGSQAESAGSVDEVALDTASDESVTAAVAAVLDRHGRIDVLVNTVGSAPAGHFDEVEPARWAAAFDSKVAGAVRTMTAALPGMRERGSGRIVNIAGTAGKEPDEWMVVAGSANAALLAVTNAAARQLAPHGITVNAVCPGPTATTRWDGLVSTYARLSGTEPDEAARVLRAAIPDGRPAHPDEVAAYIAFLASAEAAHITGTALAIDGGQSRGI